MNGSKSNPGSGGARNGLRGGKTKQVARRRSDRGIESQEPNPGRGAHDKPTVWSHGPYVMIRPARGPGVALRRAGTGSRSHVYGGDSMTNLAGSSDTTTTIRDVSKAILDDSDDDFNVDFDDGDDAGGDGGDGEGRELIERQGKRIVTRNASGGGRGQGGGGGRGSGREIMTPSSAGDGGQGSEQVNSHGSTDYSGQPTIDAYQLLYEPSDYED
ncbi:uncharacterized protein LOC143587784 [Bidens hawaiensis]|uniref:uncharacterized protein LOC143587784 n=1 Tax=Bidens hawaiensis TaxID=980011 RepID=UPI004048F350